MRTRAEATLRPFTYQANAVRSGMPRFRTAITSVAELFHE